MSTIIIDQFCIDFFFKRQAKMTTNCGNHSFYVIIVKKRNVLRRQCIENRIWLSVYFAVFDTFRVDTRSIEKRIYYCQFGKSTVKHPKRIGHHFPYASVEREMCRN